MDQLLTIEVLGQPFTFKTDSNASEARAVADFVTKAVSRVNTQCANNDTPAPDKRAILILTALNIASEYFELKSKYQDLLHNINQRSVDLIKALETDARYRETESAQN